MILLEGSVTTAIGTLLASIAEVFTKIIGSVDDVLLLYTSCTILVLFLAVKFSGAIFGFASRLLHRR